MVHPSGVRDSVMMTLAIRANDLVSMWRMSIAPHPLGSVKLTYPISLDNVRVHRKSKGLVTSSNEPLSKKEHDEQALQG